MEHHIEEHVSRKFHHQQTHNACDRTDKIETIKMAWQLLQSAHVDEKEEYHDPRYRGQQRGPKVTELLFYGYNGCENVIMHANESRFCAMILFVGTLKCLVQLVFVYRKSVGWQKTSQLLCNRLLNCFADERKIRNGAIV